MNIRDSIIILFLALLSTILLAQDSLEITTEPYVVALYKNCGNEIKIISPSVSPPDTINYRARGGSVIVKENNPGVITLVPYSPKVQLSIYRDSLLIGAKEFKVRLIPLPQVLFYADNTLIEKFNSKNETINRRTVTFTVKVIPDKIFAYYVPNDARYSVQSWKISLLRENRLITSLSFTNGTGSIKKLLSKSKPGDKILLEVNKIIRTNYLYQEEDIGIEPMLRIIQIE